MNLFYTSGLILLSSLLLACSDSVNKVSTPPDFALQKPSDSLTATAYTGRIDLSWAKLNGAEKYRIYWSTTGGDPKSSGIFVDVAGQANSYSHTTLSNGTEYFYTLAALDQFNRETPQTSNAAFATPLGAPINTQLFTAKSTITVSWDTNALGATGYNVYIAEETGINPGTYAELTGGQKFTNVSNPFDIQSLQNGNNYYVVVTSVNSSGESDLNIETSATPISIEHEYETAFEWNDYAVTDSNQSGIAGDRCLSAKIFTRSDCVHGGPLRFIPLLDITSCDGLAASDSLNAMLWKCRLSVAGVEIFSDGLREHIPLSALIDFTNYSWRPISVSIRLDESIIAQTQSEPWWSTTIQEAPATSATLNFSNRIYVVTSNRTASYSITTLQNIGIVVKPGVVLTGDNALNTGAVIFGGNTIFIWIEGTFDGAGAVNGINLENTSMSTIDNTTVKNAGVLIGRTGGIILENTHASMVSYSNVISSTIGFVLSAPTHNFFTHITAIANSSQGISSDGNSNIWQHISANNNQGTGFRLRDASDTIISHLSANNNDTGFALMQFSDNNLIQNSSFNKNNQRGIYISDSDNNKILNSVSAFNDFGILFALPSSNHSFHNLAIVNNITTGISAGESTLNVFTGKLLIGSNGNDPDSDCVISLTNQSGLNADCTSEINTHTLHRNVSALSTFIGPVNFDAANQTDAQGIVIVNSDTDWLSFDNTMRGLGLYSNISVNRGSCRLSFSCQIIDWSLQLLDTGNSELSSPLLLNSVTSPNPNDLITHNWTIATSTTFLDGAIEFIGDNRGNENGLCELNMDEVCLVAPNIGSYQGHGNIVNAGTINIENKFAVNLKAFEKNGY